VTPGLLVNRFARQDAFGHDRAPGEVLRHEKAVVLERRPHRARAVGQDHPTALHLADVGNLPLEGDRLADVGGDERPGERKGRRVESAPRAISLRARAPRGRGTAEEKNYGHFSSEQYGRGTEAVALFDPTRFDSGSDLF
jgi:hypothetical protein